MVTRGCGERGGELVRRERQLVEVRTGILYPEGCESRCGQPDPHRDELCGIRADDVGGRPVEDDATRAVDHDRAGEEAHRGIEVVLDQQDRAVAGGDDVGECGVHIVDALGVEVGCRLVEHDQRRAHRQGAGDRETLPPAARETVGVLVSPVPQADAAQCVFGPRAHLVERQQQVLGTEGDLVVGRAGDDLRIRILEDHRDVRAQRGGEGVGGVESAGLDRPRHGRGHRVGDQSVERERQRRFARTGRAEQQHDLAGVDVEGDVFGGGVCGIGVRDREVTHAEKRRR